MKRVCKICGAENPYHWQDFCKYLNCSGPLKDMDDATEEKQPCQSNIRLKEKRD